MKSLAPLEVPLVGTQLIEASAGTGKTYTITTLFVRMLLETERSVDSILLVTFTNAATAELKERIRRRLREALAVFEAPDRATDRDLLALARRSRSPERARERLRAALRDVDQTSIFTIHGFCQHALSKHAFDSGARFDVTLVADARQMILEITQDFWQQELVDAPQILVEYLRRRGISAARLSSLARIAVSWPEMPVAHQTAPESAEPALHSFFRAREAVARAWSSDGESIGRLLATSTALNRNAYSRASLDRWCRQMDGLAAQDPTALGGFFDEVRKFSKEELRRGTKKGYAPPEHPFFERCDDLWSAWSSVLARFDSWVLSLSERLVAFVRDEFPRRKQRAGVQTFDDLLYQMRDALRGPNGAALAARLTADYGAALIDEFHDTDPVQYEIFRTLFGGASKSLFLIGDPKQAIYAFRGADIYAYLSAVRDSAARWTLGTNFRSDPGLVRAINTLFSSAQDPFLFEDIRFAPVEAGRSQDAFEPRDSGHAALDVVFVPGPDSRGHRRRPSPDDVPRLVACEIGRLLHSDARLGGRRVLPGDIAVLTRSNRDARDVQVELRRLGIVSVLHGDSSVLDTEEAREMAFVLRAMAEPSNASAVKAALATTLLGLDATELFELRDDEAWQRWITLFATWHDLWESHGFVQAIRRAMRDVGAAPRLLGMPGGERKLTNFSHLVEIIHQEAVQRRLRIPGVLGWYDEVRLNDAAREGSVAPETQQIRLESDSDAVQLTTMHRSKGLEYPIVYCPYLWRGWLLFSGDEENLRYHDPEDDDRIKLDLRPKDQKMEAVVLAEREALAENLRLAYVALTRAKHHCVVFWGAFRASETSALGYLLHQSDPGAGAFVATPAARIQSMDDRDLEQDLTRLVRRSEGAIGLRRVDPTEPPVYQPLAKSMRPLAARTARRSLSQAFRVSSFSALTSESANGRDPRGGRDVDIGSAAPIPRERPPPERCVRLSAFPRGARSGELLHEILERVDFQSVRSAECRSIVDDLLTRHGLDSLEWGPVVHEALGDVVETPLDDTTLRLHDVAAARRMNELEFTFPVGRAERGRMLTARRLAAAFRDRDNSKVIRAYGERLARLEFLPLAGYLHGYIDLVFENTGRYYLVDYKSNFLGSSPEDYSTPRLLAAMDHHHYFLQSHLYTVALHKYLRARVPQYEYARHFGGIFYLFLRGMSPNVPKSGVFFDRPSEKLVDSLLGLLDPTAGAA